MLLGRASQYYVRMRPIVTDRVAWSIGLFGLSVTVLSPAKTAEQNEMLLGLRTRVGPVG